MADDSSKKDVIDLRLVFLDLWKRKKTFFKVWIITFILACVYILPQPRTYVTELSLAPELGGQSSGGALSSIASSFGFDIGSMDISDAFYPELYPDVMATNEFVVDLLYTQVKTQDGEIETTYLDYILKHHKKNPYFAPLRWSMKKIKGLFEESRPIRTDKRLDPKYLSRLEDDLVKSTCDIITCNVDAKTSVITINVKEQDPLVCAILADSARVRLQKFITDYRTSKARIDEKYYKQLVDNAKVEYDSIAQQYNRFCDAHQNVILQSYISERDELENDLQTKMSTYNAMQTQYQAAKAKVQEQTPAFTILKAASVPVKPQGPKRMLFVVAMLFLSSIVTAFYLLRHDIMVQLMSPVYQTNY